MLDAAERHRVIEGVAENLTRYYVDPDIARTMAQTLKDREGHGDYDTVTDAEIFAQRLTQKMADVSHDKYLALAFTATDAEESPSVPNQDAVDQYRRHLERNNCTFEKIEILPHNIGYLKLNSFPDTSVCRQVATAAMAKLNQSDAIIFDLRDNPGGYANMVALLAAYLFDHSVHLNDFYNRATNSTEESWTLPPVPGNQLANKPAYILTSSTTFSAAEAFSYDLRMLKRVP